MSQITSQMSLMRSQISSMRSQSSQMRSLRVNITEKFNPLTHSIFKFCKRKMYQCQNCEKTFSRKNNMKRHQIQTCKGKAQNGNILNPTSMIQPSKDKIIGQPDKDNVVGNILNKAVQRANVDMNVKPLTNKVPFHPKSSAAIPSEAVDAVKINSLSDIAMHSGKSDSEETDSDSEVESSESSDSEGELSQDDVEFMPNNVEELKQAFRDLFNKLHGNIAIYNKLVFLLDELKRMGGLTKEECNAMNICLQEKMNI